MLDEAYTGRGPLPYLLVRQTLLSQSSYLAAESHLVTFPDTDVIREMHESPDVPNYVGGRYGRGIRLIPGMTIAIEPMINMGTWQIKLMSDGWTAVTAVGKPSAHYENTVALTDGDPIILTLSKDNHA